MKRGSKIWLGVATIWPLFYLLLFFVFMISMFFIVGGDRNDGTTSFLIVLMLPLHLLTMLLIMGLPVFYIVNVFRNDRVVKNMKVLWAVVIFFGSIIAMPIYWYLYIWRAVQAGSDPSLLSPAQESVPRATAASSDGAYVPPRETPDWR